MKNENINSKIVSLWNKYFQNDHNVYAPLFYDEFKQGGLLFVGMNPSFSIRSFKSILKNTEYKNLDPEIFLKWNNVSVNLNLIEDCIKIENYAYTNYSLYFGRMKEIAKSVNLGWQHIDLFLYRETAQNKFVTRITNGMKLNQFALDQIAIFEEMLIAIKPKCIVVNNAFGSDLFRVYTKDNLEWDNRRGFHWYTKDGAKIPIFFSSMLSGQRSLDRWSYERLRWHIEQAIKVN